MTWYCCASPWQPDGRPDALHPADSRLHVEKGCIILGTVGADNEEASRWVRRRMADELDHMRNSSGLRQSKSPPKTTPAQRMRLFRGLKAMLILVWENSIERLIRWRLTGFPLQEAMHGVARSGDTTKGETALFQPRTGTRRVSDHHRSCSPDVASIPGTTDGASYPDSHSSSLTQPT